jgi:hypothetical protein
MRTRWNTLARPGVFRVCGLHEGRALMRTHALPLAARLRRFARLPRRRKEGAGSALPCLGKDDRSAVVRVIRLVEVNEHCEC